MMKIIQMIPILCLLTISTDIYGQKIPADGLKMPESVTAKGNRFFVSNQGKDPLSKDGDGCILEIDASGKIIKRRFLPKTGVLNTPKGLAIIGDVLYVADIDRILGYDIQTRKQVFELNLEGDRKIIKRYM